MFSYFSLILDTAFEKTRFFADLLLWKWKCFRIAVSYPQSRSNCFSTFLLCRV